MKFGAFISQPSQPKATPAVSSTEKYVLELTKQMAKLKGPENLPPDSSSSEEEDDNSFSFDMATLVQGSKKKRKSISKSKKGSKTSGEQKSKMLVLHETLSTDQLTPNESSDEE